TKARLARRDQRSLFSPDHRLDQWSRLARSFPQRGRAPLKPGAEGRPGSFARLAARTNIVALGVHQQRQAHMAHPVSPLAPKTFPDLPQIAGVRFATAEAGIKYKNRTDVLLAAFDEGTAVAGVFTSSRCPSAPVDWCRA